jgi:WD40 repeat protein
MRSLDSVKGSTGIRLFGVLSGKEIRKLPKLPGTGVALVFSPDGRTLAATRGSYTINLWDVAADRQPHPIVGHEAPIQSVAFFPDGKRLVSTDTSSGMIVWDIASGRDLAHPRNHNPTLFPAVNGDGESLHFIGSGLIYHWDLRTGRQTAQATLVGQAMNALALSPDGRSVASMTYQPRRQLHLCDLKDGKASVLLDQSNTEWVSPGVRTLWRGWRDLTILVAGYRAGKAEERPGR